MLRYEPLRGMEDRVPPESEELAWIENTFREVARSFGYREVRTPTIERFELFALKSGEEIRRSMYVFKDKAGREVALRPEVTPSIIRLYLRSLNAWPKPIRLFYIANVFRYDEPQRGRYREFTQAGVEVLGASGIWYDVELVLLLEEFYDRISLRNRWYLVNNIAVLKRLASRANLSSEEMDKFLHYMDKKMFDNAISMVESKADMKVVEFLKKLIDVGKTSIDDVYRLASEAHELGLADESQALEELAKYCEILKSMGVRIEIDVSFARGIAYYTGTIFEVRVPELDISIAGGGRYDDLTVVYGGPPLPCTGFAIGVERTLLALKSQGVKYNYGRKRALVLIISGVDAVTKIYNIVREARTCCDVQMEVAEPRTLSRWFEYADKQGFDYVVVIGKRELEEGTATVKDLRSWKQTRTKLDTLKDVLCGTVG